MAGVFKVSMLIDECYGRPHYPSYMVSKCDIGIASSLDEAEKLINSPEAKEHKVHSFLVDEMPLDKICIGGQSLSSYIYDPDGKKIDQKLYSNITGDDGVFPGRDPEEIRFREGDIVEVYDGEKITVGFVVGVPVSRKKAARINSNAGDFHLDDTDDSYTILFDSFYSGHCHVGSLSIFRPRFKMHPGVERRLKKAYNDYLTFPAFCDVANIAAKSQLEEIIDEIGQGGKITLPLYPEDSFTVILPLEKGEKTVIIDCNKVYNHIDKVRTTLFRIAGKPVSGKGFRVRKNEYFETGTLTF